MVLLHLISKRVSEVLDLIFHLGTEKNSKDMFSWDDPLTRGIGQMSLSMKPFKLLADKAGQCLDCQTLMILPSQIFLTTQFFLSNAMMKLFSLIQLSTNTARARFKSIVHQFTVFDINLNKIILEVGLPWQLTGKESTCQGRRYRFSSWVGKIPCRRKWNPFQYSCLGNHMDRGE